MNDSLVVEVIIILVLIAANGFFALSEFSVIASRKGGFARSAREIRRRHRRPFAQQP